MRKLVTLGLVFVMVGTSSACGGDGRSTKASVILDEWTVAPSAAETRAGEAVFEVRNDGAMAHQLVVVKSDLPPEMLPVANGSVALTQVKVVESIDPIAAGASATLRFDATPGKYVLLCNVPGHYQQGMAASFLVEP